MNEEMFEKEILITKLILIGAYRVGKTSIRRSYMGEAFVKDHLSTLGADFSVKKVDLGPKSKKNVELELQIWDIAGQISFTSLRQRFFRGASIAFLVFDVNDRNTFLELDTWIAQLWEGQDKNKLVLIFIGNKSDLGKAPYTVSEEDVNEYIARLKEENELHDLYTKYFVTSAKTGKGIDDVFGDLASHIYTQWQIDHPQV